MLKKFAALLLLCLVLATSAVTVWAQSEDYRLNLHRTFGYSAGSQIRGSFTIEVVGPGEFKTVTFQIDGQVMAQVITPPFRLAFQTSQYPVGWHDLSAVVETTQGQKFNTPTRRVEFATAEQEANSVATIIVPVLGGIFLVMLLGMGSQLLFLRKHPAVSLPMGAPRNYGFIGGCVCPQCHRAYPLHWWAPNLGFRTKFDRCDFCGKWSIVRALSRAELTTAEAAELQMAQPAPAVSQKTEAERLNEMIEKSKYTNL